jgi:hypothetical protein
MAEPEMDGYGRYKLPDPETGQIKPYTRTTTLAKTLEDQYGITNWKLRSVIIGLSKRESLMDLAYASDPEDKKQLAEIAEKAMQAAQADERSNQGTALHKFMERVDAGDDPQAPKRWQDEIDAYIAFKDAEGIQTHPSMIERITVVPELNVAGKIDRIVRHEGTPKIGDLKTGESMEFGGMSMAIQLAVYAHGAGLFNDKTNLWESMPTGLSQDEGLIVHLPAGKAMPRLYRVDLVKGWQMAKASLLVREWRKDKTFLTWIGGAPLE